MFGIDWWILLGATIFFNVVWPPITLGITLYWGVKSTNKTLNKADKIHEEVKGAIKDIQEREKLEQIFLGALDDGLTRMKAVIDGKFGELDKKVDIKLNELEQQKRASTGDRIGNILEGALNQVMG